ncbi:class I adenylate-forming enzyme family protein [Acuticoccus kandeliae]|uniref:class I adenylate-forming enzyme family protein n=1 Tax=Acuticoccus kandeliae TaxID=2073160 RepID=UPI000D3E5E06|nr:AMP-binding protein [Acuticoccus kandeliae]
MDGEDAAQLAGPPLTTIAPVADLLAAGLATRPEADAVVSRDIRWTFRALDTASDRLAAAYAALGLRPGDRIASLMPNRGAVLVHYLACLKGRFVAVPLNYRYTAAEIDHALERCGAAAILHHIEREDDMRASATAMALPLGHILYGYEEGVTGPRFEEMIETARDWTPPPHREDDPAFILFTSGSTGPAKGVTHTYASMSAMCASTAAGFELTADDIMLPASSLSHLGALLFSLAALSVGARVVVARHFAAREILTMLRRERPTVLCILPVALFGVVRDPDVRADDFTSLRLLRSGSDKVPKELGLAVADLAGLAIDEGLGCSEIGNVTLNPPSGRIVMGSIGTPVPGVTVRVAGADGIAPPPGEDGQLLVRAPGLMRGYWGDPAATATVVRGGWFETGDLVRYDSDGYLWFRGRKKQIIVHDGSNIFPQEVEEALLAHPAVESAGVIGVHDVLHGENVRAYIVIRRGANASADDLIAFAYERVGYKAPEEIAFLEAMPLNPTGKVDRTALKALAAARHVAETGERLPTGR